MNTDTVDARAGTAKYLHLLMHACSCHSFRWLSFTDQTLSTCYPLWLLVFFAGESDSEAHGPWRTIALEWTVLLCTKELLSRLLPEAFLAAPLVPEFFWLDIKVLDEILLLSSFYSTYAVFCLCWLSSLSEVSLVCLFVCLFEFLKGTGCNCIVYYAEEGLWSLFSMYTYVTLHSSFLSRYFYLAANKPLYYTPSKSLSFSEVQFGLCVHA